MRALNAWLENHENTLANIGAFIMTFLLLVFICNVTHAGTERIHLGNMIQVPVFSTDEKGTWHVRVGMIEEFTDGVVSTCFEFKDKVIVECLVLIKDSGGEVLLVPARLREEKT